MISNNFGRRKNDPAKDRMALETYASLRGYKHGEVGRNHFQTCPNGTSEKFTLSEIAKELLDTGEIAKCRKSKLWTPENGNS